MPDKTLLLTVLLALFATTAAHADLTDPTRPSYALPESADNAAPMALRVSAVFISGERRIAVVNGQRLRVGDEIAGAIVSSIAKDKVSFVRGDRAFSISLLSARGRQ